MAGMPITRKFFAALDAAGGEEYAFGKFADGLSIHALAAEFGVSKWLLYKWLHREEGRWERYLAFKRDVLAHTLAEDALELVDTADESSSPSVQSRKSRADVRRWLAAQLNPHDYGKGSTQGSLTINADAIYLEALQAPRALPAPPPRELMEAEIVEEAPARRHPWPPPKTEVAPALEDLL